VKPLCIGKNAAPKRIAPIAANLAAE